MCIPSDSHAGHRLNYVVRRLFPDRLLGPRDTPMGTWTITNAGRTVTGEGTYDAVWYAARDERARSALEAGERTVSFKADHDVTVTLTVCT